MEQEHGKFIQISAAAHGDSIVIVALDEQGRIWKKHATATSQWRLVSE